MKHFETKQSVLKVNYGAMNLFMLKIFKLKTKHFTFFVKMLLQLKTENYKTNFTVLDIKMLLHLQYQNCEIKNKVVVAIKTVFALKI